MAVVSAARGRRVGAIWDDAGEFVEDVGEAIVDVGSSVVDALSDAGAEIGSVLKVIAPIVALVPGWGTALSVAISAAASWASQDSIDDALIGLASSAMPGPVSRAAFDAGADMSRTALEGGDIGAAAIRSCRSAAGQVGGDRAVAAFDVGLQVARGERIGDASWALARQQVASSGTAALAAFDAAVTLKNGGDAKDVVLAGARAYLEQTGGAPALVAFDIGTALAQGKALQDAGYAALKNFARGNTGLERAIVFGEKMAKAAREGKSVVGVFVDELSTDVAVYGVSRAANTLGPIIERWVPAWSEWGVSALAARLGVSELMAHAAQAIMRTGEPDAVLYARLTQTPIEEAIAKYGAKTVVSLEVNATYGEALIEKRAELLEDIVRMDSDSLSYGTALLGAPVRAGARVRLPAGSSSLPAEEPWTDVAALEEDAPAPVSGSSSSRSSVVADVALGVTVAGACLALVLWARSS